MRLFVLAAFRYKKKEIDAALYTNKHSYYAHNWKARWRIRIRNLPDPYGKLLGTPKEDQEMIVFDGVAHGIPKDTIIVNPLKWLKQHLIR